MLSEIRKAGFSEEFIDFVYVKYFYGYKVIAISIDGYLPEKRMLLDVKMPVKVLYIPKFPDVVVIGEDVMI